MQYLDLITGSGCLLASLACVVLHILSSRHIGGLDLPGYVRNGFFVLALTMLWRAIDLWILGTDPFHFGGAGHVNIWGVIATAALAYTLGSLAWCTFSRRARAKTVEIADQRADFWSRFHF